MRASLVALGFLLAGCRQVLGLDSPLMVDGAVADGPVDVSDHDAEPLCGAHDFDADGIGDDCDLCPHKASQNADVDSDGVGDECDPRPQLPGDKRALWAAFYDPADIAGWVDSTGNGSWSVSNSALHQTNKAFTQLTSPVSFTTNVYFATRLVIRTPSTDEVGFCAANIPGQQYYCCAASDTLTPKVRRVVQYAGTSGQVSDEAAYSGDLAPGATIDMEGSLRDTEFTCTFTQGQSKVAIMGAAGGHSGSVTFYTTTAVDYRYMFVVTIGS